ncbi:MAG: acetylxylan esterase [Candidatus Handelsmanbacteria bacterium]|nr:acetylxylan esterase [Candidatus Handelsmanbacteria bacterium]
MAKANSDLYAQLMRAGADLQPRLSWQAGSAGEHRAWRRRFRPCLGRLMGRMPEAVPLAVRWAEKLEPPGFVRHKIYVQAEAHYWVPAYYYVPRGARRPPPALVCLHGHSGILPYIGEGTEAQRQKAMKLALDFAPFFAAQGYVTIAPIQRGWNETAIGIDPHETGCQRLVLDAFMIGQTPVGLRCWDASRLVDFLETREEVDPGRIGVAGLSGGGMVGLFWAALEKRVQLAMIAGYYCTFRDSVYAIYHCLCNCVPGIMEWAEMREVAALVAPRPLLVISGTEDRIFPIRATRAAYRQLRPVYEVLGAGDRLQSDFFPGPHAWSNRKTMAFLRQHWG